jgi:hypothetical protein
MNEFSQIKFLISNSLMIAGRFFGLPVQRMILVVDLNAIKFCGFFEEEKNEEMGVAKISEFGKF